MKQHITADQWIEIPLAKRAEILGVSKDVCEFMLEANQWEQITIGKMIEILNLKGACIRIKQTNSVLDFGCTFANGKYWGRTGGVELCDALWEAVKKVLKEEE